MSPSDPRTSKPAITAPQSAASPQAKQAIITIQGAILINGPIPRKEVEAQTKAALKAAIETGATPGEPRIFEDAVGLHIVIPLESGPGVPPVSPSQGPVPAASHAAGPPAKKGSN